MEHQVILTFDVDGRKVQENAEKEAGRQIAQAVLKEVLGDTYAGSYAARRNAQYFLGTELKQFFQENREEILEKAIKEVVNSLVRSKIVREKLQSEIEKI